MDDVTNIHMQSKFGSILVGLLIRSDEFAPDSTSIGDVSGYLGLHSPVQCTAKANPPQRLNL